MISTIIARTTITAIITPKILPRLLPVSILSIIEVEDALVCGTVPLLELGVVIWGIKVDCIPVAPPMSVSGMLVPSGIISPLSAKADIQRTEIINSAARATPINALKRFLSLFLVNNILLLPFIILLEAHTYFGSAKSIYTEYWSDKKCYFK